KAGNYVLSSSTATVGADITKATITVTAVASDKVYDGTTDAQVTLAGATGIVAGDDVTVSIESASFDDANAGENKTVNVTYEVTGADAGNYTVEDGGVTADITKAALTLSFTAADKVYDGTTDAGITGYTLTGLAGGETAEVTGYAGAFADKNVGAGKAVTVSGYTITGIDLANYELTVLDTAASITPAALTVNFTAEDKNYDGTAAASAAFASFTGLIAGDDVTVTVNSASFADKNVGTDKAVTVNFAASGADASNYTISAGTAAADISAIELLVVVAAEDKVYDGTTAATATLLDVVGLIDGDDVTVTANNVTFNDKNAGVKTASAESETCGGADAGNYIILVAFEGAVITPKALTITGTAVADKNYDGTTVAAITLGEVGGVLAGDDVTVTASGAFPSADAGTYNVPVSYTVGGADAANYAAPASETISATILAPETPSMRVTTDLDVVDAWDGLISLREALGVYFQTDGTYTLEADGSITYGKDASNVTVTFDDDLTEIKANETFELTSANDGVVINGVNAAGQENHILFKGYTFSAFTVSGDIEATFNNLIFRENSADLGAAINVIGADSNVAVSGSEFSENSALFGAAINVTRADSNVAVSGSEFSGNFAVEGGAIRAFGALTVTDSTFSENNVSREDGGAGGAIFCYDGDLTVTESTFTGNSAEHGGAICNFGNLTVTDSEFIGNSAGEGGAIYVGAREAAISGSYFTGNSGAAIRVLAGALTVTQSLIAENTTGIYIDAYSSDVTVRIDWTTVANNDRHDLYTQDYYSSSSTTVDVFGSILTNVHIDQTTTATYTSSIYQSFTGSGTHDISDPNNYQLQPGDSLFVGGTDPFEAYKLADDSVAINRTGIRTTDGNPTTDLAGNVRPYAGIYDYGAFEWSTDQPETPSMHVTTDQDVVDAYDGVISLREALGVYFKTDGTYTIETDGSITYGKDSSNVTVTFDDDLTEIKADSTFELTAANDGVIINGVNAAGQENHILFKGYTFSAFTVSGDIEATFNNLIFR
ncbi:MAG: hypothetical protein IKE69_03725, partial [Thermoguttaceae bacterium]|nr:hypothetical protein [Thermoguttaceae bacterium]